MTRKQVREKLQAVERELNTIANSDFQMGVYDIEHLENARSLIHDLILAFMRG